MWINRADGNNSKSSRIRAVCGGDFSTIGLPDRQVNVRRKRSSPAFQRAQFFFRDSRHVEILFPLRPIRKRHLAIRRAKPHVAQREFIFLRMLPAGRHVVHRPLLRQEPAEPTSDEAGQNQRLVRGEALECCGECKPLVQHHQLVQKRRPRSPMADDEDRRLLRFSSAQFAATEIATGEMRRRN